MGAVPDVVGLLVAAHLRCFFEELFVSLPLHEAPEIVLGVVNHVSAWDAELLLLATRHSGRQFLLLGDQHVVDAHPGVGRLGIVTLDPHLPPTEAIRTLVERARRRGPTVLWVMPQRSHWPLAQTTRIEHAAASFGRHLGDEAIWFGHLHYEFNALRRPFVSLALSRPDNACLGVRMPREAWLEGLKNAGSAHYAAAHDGEYVGLLRPGRYGHTSGVPTSLRGLDRLLRQTSARRTSATPITIVRQGMSLDELQAHLRPLGLDRAASLTGCSQP